MKKITPTAPVIRFRGFTDVWEQRKLNNVADVRDGTHDSPRYRTEGHPFITSKNIKDGFINYADIQYISDEDFNEINKRSKVEVNDILMGMIGTIGNMALVREKPDYAIKNVALIKDTKKVHYLYLYHFLHSNNVVMQLFSGIDGGTQKFVSLNNIRNLNILFPNLKEQVKLGSFFEKIDYDIALYQRKLEQQKKLKKYFLQNMFPAKGEKVPKIRFQGFTEDWEQRKVLELTNETYGGGTPKTSVEEYWTGAIPWIQSSDITEHDVNSINPQKYISDKAVCESATKLVPENSLAIVTRVGVGKLVIMPFSYTTSQDFLSLSKLKSDIHFTAYLLYKKLQNGLGAVQGTSIKGVTKEELLSKEIMIPERDEQIKIGQYFSNLDHLITLHQRKIDQLQAMKKFMLQNLFV